VVLYGYIPCGGEVIQNGSDATDLLMKVIFEDVPGAPANVLRSYGNASRGSEVTKQDDYTGALTELLCSKLPTMKQSCVDEWIEVINQRLKHRLSNSRSCEIRVLGRLEMPVSTFNAEMNVIHRRVEYVLPCLCFIILR